MQIKNLSVTMKHFKFLTFSVTLLAVFLLSDCGGGGTTPPPTTLSFDFLTDANLRSCAQATGATSISQVTSLDCSGLTIKGLSDIAQLTNLTSLNLNNNDIKDADITILASMHWLTELHLSNNDSTITNFIELAVLDNLTDLTLSGNDIDLLDLLDIIDGLPMSSLNMGSTTDNVADPYDAADLDALVAKLVLMPLTNLRLDNNGITTVTPLTPLSGQLTTLTLDNNDITDITNLQDFNGLVSLHLLNNPITNITPLAGPSPMVLLTELTLSGGNIAGDSGFAPLAPLSSLKVLRLKNTGFVDTDFVHLATYIANLTTLNLSGNSNTIEDISPLSSAILLQDLDLSNNPDIGPAVGTDFNALASLDELITLRLDNTGFVFNNFSDLSVTTITNLEVLSLSENTISDFTPIDAMAKLTTLKLNTTTFQNSDLTDLSNVMPNLTSLSLDSNNIVDATPYAALTNLNTLSLASNNIDNTVPNVSSLTTLTSADSIELSDNIGMSCNDLTTLIDGLATGVVSPAPAADTVNCTAP